MQTRIRMPVDVADRVKSFAARDRRSFNSAASKLIEIGLEALNASQRSAQAPTP